MILGTAGHIDHGKTALVKALTGVDTDRLPEEKRRGITIDLGFAPLILADGTTLGVVDVPGHEAFVRTMLAGATGIDLALLVIAADEGPMPQTREHLAILELLGVTRAVVALTKRDLVDEDWLTLVSDDVRALLGPTPLANSPILATSVVSGQGIPELKAALGAVASRQPPTASSAVFRLPVDRSFSVKGTGTVVTGTVWSGSLALDDTVRIMPLGASARVRALQSHGAAVPRVGSGTRAAVALAGVEPESVGRGATLTTSAAWESTLVLRADLTLLPDAPELRPRSRVRFHLATSDVGARVVAVGSPVAASTRRPVRIVLDAPVMAGAGDRFVLRSASPLATIGGGVITDPNAPRRARPMPALALSPEARFELLVNEAGGHGLADAVIPVRVGGVDIAGMARSGHVTRVGVRWFATPVVAKAREAVLELVRRHHADHPLDRGALREDVRSRLTLDPTLFDEVVRLLESAGTLATAGADLRIAGWSPALAGRQQQLADALLAALESAGAEPPSLAELEGRFGQQTAVLLRHLERERRVVHVEESRWYAPSAVDALVRRLERAMAGKGALAPTDLKGDLGVSRKYLIPFLEYCDRRGLTVREGNGRVWKGHDSTADRRP